MGGGKHTPVKRGGQQAPRELRASAPTASADRWPPAVRPMGSPWMFDFTRSSGNDTSQPIAPLRPAQSGRVATGCSERAARASRQRRRKARRGAQWRSAAARARGRSGRSNACCFQRGRKPRPQRAAHASRDWDAVGPTERVGQGGSGVLIHAKVDREEKRLRRGRRCAGQARRAGRGRENLRSRRRRERRNSR